MRLSAAIRLPISYGRLLANGTIASIIASQNLITMRTSGAGLTLLESQLQRLPDIEQTVILAISFILHPEMKRS